MRGNMKKNNILWDDNPIDVTQEANFIWSIANKLRGTYLPDKYGDVIIPMTIIRRFECTLKNTKNKVVKLFDKDPKLPIKRFERESGFQFYNVSHFDLKELCNDADHLESNFKSYIKGFSTNVQDIMKQLDLDSHIKKMSEGGCLYSVVKAFSELDLNPETYDSIKMGYIFENLIGRFFQNVDAGQYYTGRDIIKTLVAVLTAEGSDYIFGDHQAIYICDQAAGTGGMLSTAYSYFSQMNSTAEIHLYGQELMGQSYAIGLAEMLIKGQDATNFRHVDTFKEDCFSDKKMNYVIENPPFGTSWSGKDAKEGQEDAVKKEFNKGIDKSRWGIGLPGGGDSQLLFMQSAYNKMDPKVGRAAIIENGSPLFSGGTSSGESQIRRYFIENDKIEAIIALPTDLFYNTGIPTYVWILSNNKRKERIGKIQLIDATSIYHKLRKALGNKKNEITPEDRAKIVELYSKFESNEYVQIFDKEDFIYKEYTIMQPLQRSYAINEERMQKLNEMGGISISSLSKKDMDNLCVKLNKKVKQITLDDIDENISKKIQKTLEKNVSEKIYYKKDEFILYLSGLLNKYTVDNKLIEKIAEKLSVMDKKAEIQKDKDGNVLYDKETKDIEIVNIKENIDDYTKREVLPHIPDAKAFFEEDLTKKKPIIKTGAEIPFTRTFYKYEELESSNDILLEIENIEREINLKMKELKKINAKNK